jgi:hypothetical protein
LDELIDMPEHSALTLARIAPETARIDSVSWRQTGLRGFYPASTVKLPVAAMVLQLLDENRLPIDAVVELGDEPAMTFRELLAETLVFSGNDTFNTLAEFVGFARMQRELQAWGTEKFLLRRHFKNPRYNSSRSARVFNPDGSLAWEIAPRPAVDVPIHDGNGFDFHNPESNWACTDDLVRLMAAILFGPTRLRRYFPQLTGWCGMTNQCFPRQGLRQLTALDPAHPGFVILNKPGWWEPDQANVDISYVYDCSSKAHYLLGLYFHGTMQMAESRIPVVTQQLFGLLRSAPETLFC